MRQEHLPRSQTTEGAPCAIGSPLGPYGLIGYCVFAKDVCLECCRWQFNSLDLIVNAACPQFLEQIVSNVMLFTNFAATR
jgi:hypothetical protein